MSGCSLSNVVMTSPSLDWMPNADQVQPPTPTDSTSSKTALDGDQIPYEELLSQYAALQSSNTHLQSNLVALQRQNDYWTKLYTYVEQGLTLKIAELSTLREENQQLKKRNLQLTTQLEEARAMTQNTQQPPNVTKRMQQLQDQVRARDLVIDLMKKAEQERSEREMQEKLDMQRQQLELQMGLAIGPPIAKQIASTGGSRRSNRTRSQIVKPRGRPPTRRQPSNPKGRHPEFREPSTLSNLEGNEPDPSRPENVVDKENNRSIDNQLSKVTEIDEEMQLEMEFNEALKELNDEFSDEALEGLFNERL